MAICIPKTDNCPNAKLCWCTKCKKTLLPCQLFGLVENVIQRIERMARVGRAPVSQHQFEIDFVIYFRSKCCSPFAFNSPSKNARNSSVHGSQSHCIIRSTSISFQLSFSKSLQLSISYRPNSISDKFAHYWHRDIVESPLPLNRSIVIHCCLKTNHLTNTFLLILQQDFFARQFDCKSTTKNSKLNCVLLCDDNK